MRWIVPVVLVLALAGCSRGGSTSGATPSPSATVPGSVPGGPTGAPAPEALSGFTCQADGDEDDAPWKATGLLTNDGKAAATYQVTVYVGPVDGQQRSARTEEVANVAAGASTKFEVDDIDAEGEACQVQVLRTQG